MRGRGWSGEVLRLVSERSYRGFLGGADEGVMRRSVGGEIEGVDDD